MPILCERHTTSKLRQFEDLQTLQACGESGFSTCSPCNAGQMVQSFVHRVSQAARLSYLPSPPHLPLDTWIPRGGAGQHQLCVPRDHHDSASHG